MCPPRSGRRKEQFRPMEYLWRHLHLVPFQAVLDIPRYDHAISTSRERGRDLGVLQAITGWAFFKCL